MHMTAFTVGLVYIRHHHQHIRATDCQEPNCAENLLFHFPAFAVFQSLEEEILEWVEKVLALARLL